MNEMQGPQNTQIDFRTTCVKPPPAHCRVLIILGLDVLGQADTVGSPQEYDKVAAGMIAQPPAGGPANYMNGRGGSIQPQVLVHLALLFGRPWTKAPKWPCKSSPENQALQCFYSLLQAVQSLLLLY